MINKNNLEKEMHLSYYLKLGRRKGLERRLYSYTIHIPERRNYKDRRYIRDRRFHNLKMVNNENKT